MYEDNVDNGNYTFQKENWEVLLDCWKYLK